MSHHAGRDLPARRDAVDRVFGSWVSGCTGWMLGGGVVLVAIILAMRRAAGAMQNPLPLSSLLALALVLGGCQLLARTVLVRQALFTAGMARAALFGLLSTATMLAGWAVSLPATSVGTLLVFWLLLAAVDLLGWQMGRRWLLVAAERSEALPPNSPRLEERPCAAGDGGPSAPEVLRTAVPAAAADEAADEAAESSEADSASAAPGEVVQSFTRVRLEDGSEMVAGWVRIYFAPQQRTNAAHVAFCPPFARPPHMRVDQQEGPRGRVKLGQVLCQGARIELKLDAIPEKEGSVAVHVEARGESL